MAMTVPTIVTDMFEASRALIAGAKIIIASDGIRDRGAAKQPTLPVTVCCVLAIEIGLKALLTLEGTRFPREGGGHSLKALFEALSLRAQQELLSLQVGSTGRNPAEAKQQLDREALTFVNWRYAYEHEYLSTSPAFLHDFAVALSEYLKSSLQTSNK
jgi:hypothetical protein